MGVVWQQAPGRMGGEDVVHSRDAAHRAEGGGQVQVCSYSLGGERAVPMSTCFG